MRHTRGGVGGRETLLVLVVAGLVGGGVLVGLAEPPSAQVAVGKPAPSFALTLLSGEKVQLTEFRGRVLVLNFWASW